MRRGTAGGSQRAKLRSGRAFVRPPGREADQHERDPAEERGLDALQQPEVTRGVVHGVHVSGRVKDVPGDALRNGETGMRFVYAGTQERNSVTVRVARVLAQDPRSIEDRRRRTTFDLPG